VISPDGRKAGVIIHHVASVYLIEVPLAKEVALGKAIEGIIWRRLEQHSRMSEAALGSIASKSAA
jgi:hypothetical protein